MFKNKAHQIYSTGIICTGTGISYMFNTIYSIGHKKRTSQENNSDTL